MTVENNDVQNRTGITKCEPIENGKDSKEEEEEEEQQDTPTTGGKTIT